MRFVVLPGAERKLRMQWRWRNYGWARWESRPPLESLGNILDGRGKGRKRKGIGKRGGKGKYSQGKWAEKKGNCKRGGGKLEMDSRVERYENMNMSRGHLYACYVLKPLKFVSGVPKWKFLPGKSIWGNFLTSPTFVCTPGYAPVGMDVGVCPGGSRAYLQSDLIKGPQTSRSKSFLENGLRVPNSNHLKTCGVKLLQRPHKFGLS